VCIKKLAVQLLERLKLGKVVHMGNPSYLGNRDWRLGRSCYKASLGKKLRRTPISIKKLGILAWWVTFAISAMQEA
jgi:hypothetical protein